MSNPKLTKGGANKALLALSVLALVGGVIGGLVSNTQNASLGGWIVAGVGLVMLVVNLLGSANKLP